MIIKIFRIIIVIILSSFAYSCSEEGFDIAIEKSRESIIFNFVHNDSNVERCVESVSLSQFSEDDLARRGKGYVNRSHSEIYYFESPLCTKKLIFKKNVSGDYVYKNLSIKIGYTGAYALFVDVFGPQSGSTDVFRYSTI